MARFQELPTKVQVGKVKEVVQFDDAGHATIKIGDEDHLVLFDAPVNKHTWKHAAPKPSRWSCMSDDFQVEVMKEKEQLKEENISYGHWSVDGAFFVDIPWDDIAEDEGIGRGPDDTFQEEMADKLARAG